MGPFRWVILVLWSLVYLSGCTVSDDPAPGKVRDFSVAVTPPDLSSVDAARPAGAVGAACTSDLDCKFGKTPVCWKTRVLDDPANLPTLGGYCSSPCSTSADCGPYGSCEVIVPGLLQKYCVAGCTDAATCRHPDYACFYGASGGGGYCYPALKLSCNPTLGSGVCTDPTKACIRRTFEDLGECHDTCALGAGTCAPIGTQRQHCVYLDTTRDLQGVTTRDKFKGTTCFPLYADARMVGANCMYFDECLDTLQCNLGPNGDNKCRGLCLVGLDSGCDPGFTCKDAFAAGRGQPGLCLPN